MSPDNLKNPIRQVFHTDLDPESSIPNKLASICPVCKEGSLGVRRDPQTLILQEIDICTLCGQRVQYLDIEKLRSQDWASHTQQEE